MFAYFFIFIVASLLGYLSQTKNKLANNIFIILTITVLTLFAGLRDVSVGTDTRNYVGSFQSERVAQNNAFETSSSLETGYLILEKQASELSDGYWVLLTLIMFIAISAYLYTINKLSKLNHVSIFLLLTLGSYLFIFNGARQGMAAAIYSIAIISLLERNFLRYILWIILASFFHKTVLIMIPLYFILNKVVSFKNLIIGFVSIVFIFYTMSSILHVFPFLGLDKYSVYDNRGASGGNLLLVFYLVNFLFLFFIKKYINHNEKYEYNTFLNLTYLNLLIYIVVILFELDVNLLRFSLYFSMGLILIWPIILTCNKLRSIRMGLYIVFWVMHLIFSYVYIAKMSNINPYLLNMSIF